MNKTKLCILIFWYKSYNLVLLSWTKDTIKNSIVTFKLIINISLNILIEHWIYYHVP